MELKGSCHCKRVEFTIKSDGPIPFMVCLCSICRKTCGGGGSTINILGNTSTMRIKGKEYISEYVASERRQGAGATNDSKTKVTGEHKENWEPFETNEKKPARSFCNVCHSCLWNYDPKWKEWIYPVAGIIDSDLPPVPEIDGKDGTVYIMKNYKANWVKVPEGARVFAEYPDVGLMEWHQKHNLP